MYPFSCNNSKSHILKKVVITLFVFFLVGIGFYFSFVLNIPFRNYNFDVYAHLITIRELEKDIDQIGYSPFVFWGRGGHKGPYLLAIALISRLLRENLIAVYYAFGIMVSILLFFSALYFAQEYLNPPNRLAKKTAPRDIFIGWDHKMREKNLKVPNQ